MRIRAVILVLIELVAIYWLATLLRHFRESGGLLIAAASMSVLLAMAAMTIELTYPTAWGLVLKQMRQRALGTCLTLLSVLLGVALAVAVLLANRDSKNLFMQSDFGYELIVGPAKGSAQGLVFNTAYYLGRSEGTIPYSLYKEMSDRSNRTYGPLVRQAIPFMVGDSYKGRVLVGTSPQMFGFDDAGKPVADEGHEPWQYRVGQSFQFAQGRVFHPLRFESVIGSEVARKLNMCLDSEKDKPENAGKVSSFQATHGMPAPGVTPDIHKPVWHVVGILKPTHTANDNVLFLPIASLYAIEEHSTGMIQQEMMRLGIDPYKVTPAQLPGVLKQLGFNPEEVPEPVLRKLRDMGLTAATLPSAPGAGAATGAAASPGGDLMHDVAPKPAPAAKAGGDQDPDAYKLDAQGNIVPYLPQDEWALSAILVKTRGPYQAQLLLYRFRVASLGAMAVSPAQTMREFFDAFLKPGTIVFLVLAGLVSVVAAVSILVSIYNSVSARQKEIAIFRALGATRGKVLTLICLEAGLIGLVGGLLGLVVAHGVAALGSIYFRQVLGEGIRWQLVGAQEIGYLAGVVFIAVIAGLAPAMKAYRTPVATNLVAS